jgi:hypothetical protein
MKKGQTVDNLSKYHTGRQQLDDINPDRGLEPFTLPTERRYFHTMRQECHIFPAVALPPDRG